MAVDVCVRLRFCYSCALGMNVTGQGLLIDQGLSRPNDML